MVRMLGKRAPRQDPRNLRLARYLAPDLPPAPEACDWSGKVPVWGMMLNDEIGDCAIVAPAHMVLSWHFNSGRPTRISDRAVLRAYRKVSGYDPKDPLTDVGCVELDVLNYWRKTGIAGHSIGAFADVQPLNHGHVAQTIYLFGGAYIGLNLPLSAQTQKIWDAASGAQARPGTWGGHAVNLVGYNPAGLACVTWGAVQMMTWDFLDVYCDEFYAVFSNDILDRRRRSPVGLDRDTLLADLERVTG